MTVTVVGMTAEGKEIVECAWFEGTHRQNGSFPADALRNYFPIKIIESSDDRDRCRHDG